MKRAYTAIKLIVVVVIIALAMLPNADAVAVKSFFPARWANKVATNTDINITFDANINRATAGDGNILIFSKFDANITSSYFYDYTNFVLTVRPARAFKQGDIVDIYVNINVKDNSGNSVDANMLRFFVTSAAGSGTFNDTLFIESGGNDPYDVLLADLNNDNKLDLIVANTSGDSISIFMGDGNGTFGGPTTFAAGDAARFLAVGDFNRDGKLDVAVTNRNAGDVYVYMGDGNGTLRPPTIYDLDGFILTSVKVADLNNDGFLDLIVNNGSGSSPQIVASIFFGNGDGTFDSNINFVWAAASVAWTETSDIDNDGKVDLIRNGTDGNVGIRLGDGNGTFRPEIEVDYGGNGANGLSVFSGDLNNDGATDIVSANDNDRNISVLLGNGNATFATPHLRKQNGKPRIVKLNDMNSDGKLDIIYSNQTTDKNAVVLLGDGNGTFVGDLNLLTGASSSGMDIGDINGDGVLDIVVANDTSGVNTSNISIILGIKETTPPTVSFTNDTNLNSSPPTIIFDVNDNADVNQAAIKLRVNGILSTDFNAFAHCTFLSGDYRCRFTEADLIAADGFQDYNLTWDVNDIAGNRLVDLNRAVHIDLNRPTVTILTGITDTNTASAQIVFDVNDNFGGGGSVIQDVNFLISTGGPMAADANFSLGRCLGFDANRAIRCDFFSSLATSANISIIIDANDYAGNTADDNRAQFIYDVNNPAVTISSPTAGSYFGVQTVALQYTADDFSGTGVRKFYVNVDGGNLQANGTSTSFTFSNQSFGTHTYTVIANDFMDRNSADANLTLTLNPSQGGGSSGGDSGQNEGGELPGLGGSGNERGISVISPIAPGPLPPETANSENWILIGEQLGRMIVVDVVMTPGAIEEMINELERNEDMDYSNDLTIKREIYAIMSGDCNVSNISTNYTDYTDINNLVAIGGSCSVLRTKVVLSITNNSSRAIEDAMAIEHIPKSVIGDAKEIITTFEYLIIRKDPIIGFVLGNIGIKKRLTISYEVPVVVTKEMAEEFKMPMVYSAKVEKVVKPKVKEEKITIKSETAKAEKPGDYNLGLILIVLVICAIAMLATRFLVGRKNIG